MTDFKTCVYMYRVAHKFLFSRMTKVPLSFFFVYLVVRQSAKTFSMWVVWTMEINMSIHMSNHIQFGVINSDFDFWKHMF